MKKRVSLHANLVLLVLILSFPAQGIEQKPQGQKAKEIVNAAAVRGGLIVHPGCGDGRFTAELRLNDCYIVQGLDTDATNVKKTREHIKSLGIYGKVTADTFDGKHLPYTDNLVNLLVASNGKFQVGTAWSGHYQRKEDHQAMAERH
jgi:hypothetical protein